MENHHYPLWKLQVFCAHEEPCSQIKTTVGKREMLKQTDLGRVPGRRFDVRKGADVYSASHPSVAGLSQGSHASSQNQGSVCVLTFPLEL